MKNKKKLKDLPEVVVVDSNKENALVMVGSWPFYIQEELDRPKGSQWRDARAMVAFAEYLDQVRKDKKSEGE